MRLCKDCNQPTRRSPRAIRCCACAGKQDKERKRLERQRMREARAAGVKVYVEVLCADCGQPTNRTRRAVRCYKCSRAHANGAHGAYMREHYGSTNSGRFVNPATKAKKLYEETAKNRRITTKDLLEANTQNFGPNGFAELVNRMMRREK